VQTADSTPPLERTIEIRGTFDGAAARELIVTLTARKRDWVIEFAHASDVKLHALGALLLGLESENPPAHVWLRGLTMHHLSIVRSFGYVVDSRGRLSRAGIRERL
jgi:hypothetical protein